LNRMGMLWLRLPGRYCGRRAAFLVYAALPLLAWRLLDLLEEVINGPIKMSLGKYVVTGNAATALQLLIIGTLIYLVLSAAYTIGCLAKQNYIP